MRQLTQRARLIEATASASVALLVFFVTVLPSLALQDFKLLKGMSNIAVAVFLGEPKDAEKCGISEAAVRDAVMYPFSEAKFKVETESSIVFSVSVDTLKLNNSNTCAYSLKFFAYKFQMLKLDGREDAVVSGVLLWDGPADIGVYPINEFPHKIAELAEGGAKNFVKDWNLDNK